MDTRGPPEGYHSFLMEVAEEMYASRERFLRGNFDGYVEDTYYYVPDGGYYCWPAASDGEFLAYDDLLSGERQVVAELDDAGFEHLGTGLNRVVCRCPPDLGEDLVVKFGRCGMSENYGAGRRKNLVEHALSDTAEELPIVPCLYCSPTGEYALYPEARPADENDVDESVVADLTSPFDDGPLSLRGGEIGEAENLGWWDGELRIVDFSEFSDVEYPLGVPDHVDKRAVIDAVDTLRREGEKLDIESPGTLTTARVNSE